MAKHSRTDPVQTGGLIPLSKAEGWKVQEGDPHVRGWDVLTADGTDIGDVDDLLVDLEAQKARYLIVELNDKVPRAKGRHVAVPLGTARLDEDEDHVLLSNMSIDQVATLPSYEAGRFNREVENAIWERFGGPVTAASGRDFYNNELFDEHRFYGSRRPGGLEERRIPLAEEELALGTRRKQAGEVDIRKTVDTEHVHEQVPVMREEVEVERRPVSADRPASAELRDEEIRVPVTEEEVVVEKRPVVKEELVVKKRAVEGKRDVEADVRKERVDIDEQGDVRARVRDDESRRRSR